MGGLTTVVFSAAIFVACGETSTPSQDTNQTATSIPVPSVVASSPPVVASSPPTATPAPIPTQMPTLAQVIARVQDAVVQIKTPRGTGTGFIFDKRGLVLTNAHVVRSFLKVTVLAEGLGLAGGQGLIGDVIGVDENADLAVVALGNEGEVPHLTFGDSDEVALAQDVVAIGYPLSSLLGKGITVTRGIVSSKRRIEGRLRQ